MNSIIGKYKLIDYTMYDSNNKELKWDGAQDGVLEYSQNGKVLVLIRRTPNLNIQKLSEVDRKKLLINYVAKYKILKENKISHTIISSNHVERVGATLQRSYEFINNQLVISGEGLSGRVQLVWQKVD